MIKLLNYKCIIKLNLFQELVIVKIYFIFLNNNILLLNYKMFYTNEIDKNSKKDDCITYIYNTDRECTNWDDRERKTINIHLCVMIK